MLSSILLFLGAFGASGAQSESKAGAQAAQATFPRSMIRLHQPGRAGPAAKIKDLAWREGTWVGRMPRGPVEHVILSPRAGQMPSFVRALDGEKVWFYEISVFAEHAGTLVSRVKHFTPELAGWEAQDAFVERRLVERDQAHLYFDGLTISRTGADSITIYFLERENGREGQTLALPFTRSKEGNSVESQSRQRP